MWARLHNPSVGEVIGFHTDDLLGCKNDQGALKYHLCVCAMKSIFLFVCTRSFDGDYPLSKQICPGLKEEISYISMSRIIHAESPIQKRSRVFCVVSNLYLEGLLKHIEVSENMSRRHKWIAAEGLRGHLV